MIKDELNNAEIYYGISKRLEEGLEWLKEQDLANIKPDKYYIDDDKLYANIQEYETKSDALYEAHKRYIDIQYMIRGNELIGVCSKDKCSSAIPYDSEKDIEFMNCSQKDEWQTLNSGEFLILFPNDAHKPSITPIESDKAKNTVKKVVVKVLAD